MPTYGIVTEHCIKFDLRPHLGGPTIPIRVAKNWHRTSSSGSASPLTEEECHSPRYHSSRVDPVLQSTQQGRKTFPPEEQSSKPQDEWQGPGEELQKCDLVETFQARERKKFHLCKPPEQQPATTSHDVQLSSPKTDVNTVITAIDTITVSTGGLNLFSKGLQIELAIEFKDQAALNEAMHQINKTPSAEQSIKATQESASEKSSQNRAWDTRRDVPTELGSTLSCRASNFDGSAMLLPTNGGIALSDREGSLPTGEVPPIAKKGCKRCKSRKLSGWAEGQEFERTFVHRRLLVNASPYFQKALHFKSSMNQPLEIDMTMYQPEYVLTIRDWMFDRTLFPTESDKAAYALASDVVGLYSVAHELGIVDLQDACIEYLCNYYGVSEILNQPGLTVNEVADFWTDIPLGSMMRDFWARHLAANFRFSNIDHEDELDEQRVSKGLMRAVVRILTDGVLPSTRDKILKGQTCILHHHSLMDEKNCPYKTPVIEDDDWNSWVRMATSKKARRLNSMTARC